MDPTLVLGTWFESQFHICVYEHAILRIYISFFFFHHFKPKILFSSRPSSYFSLILLSSNLFFPQVRRYCFFQYFKNLTEN